MLRLPEYRPSERVTAETAKQDKIEIEIGNWFIQGIPNDVTDFFRFLGPCPTTPEGEARISSSQTRPITPDRFGWMFNRHDGEGEYITKIDLRGPGRGSGPKYGRPIAEGTLLIRRIHGDTPTAPAPLNPGAIRRRLYFDLILNPTKFVRNQPWPVLMGQPVENWNWPAPNMRTKNIEVSPWITDNDPEKEIVLDRKENVLQYRKLALANPEAWPHHLRRYFRAFEAAIETEFARAYNESDLTFHGSHGLIRTDIYYNLKSVETYWEFKAHNAIREVKRLELLVFPLGLQSMSRDYPNGWAETELDVNSRRILIVLPGGRKLRIYAKTNHRIRFEIIHDTEKASIASLLNEEECRKTTNDRHELLGWFNRLAEDAAETLNGVFAYIESHTEDIEPSATTYELIAEVIAAARDETEWRTMLQMLVEEDCIRISRSGSPFLEAVRKLRRKGVLKRHFGSDRVTPFYCKALKILQEQTL